MNKKFKYVIIIILCLAIISSTYIIGFSSKSEKSVEQAQNFLSSQVFRGDIKVTASGSANVEPILVINQKWKFQDFFMRKT